METKKNKIKQPVTGGIAKTPVVMQVEELECGAASLAMILAYYDKWLSLEQVREDSGVSREGSKASNITKAARSYGLNAQGYRYDMAALQENASYPCIVHLKPNHFVVLKGLRNGKVYINDPARGEIVISRKDFEDYFSGICILFSPSEEFECSGRKKGIFTFLRNRMPGAGKAFAILALMAVLTSLFAIVSAGFVRFLADNMLERKNPKLLVFFTVLLTVFALVQIVAAMVRALLSLRIKGKYTAVGNSTYFWHVLRLPMSFFSLRTPGDIEQRRLAHGNIAAMLVERFAPLVVNTVMLLCYFFIMLRYSVLMTVVGVVSVIINIVVNYYISRRRINMTRVLMRDEARLYGTTVAGIEKIESIKSSGAENSFFKKWSGYQAGVNAEKVKFANLDTRLGKVPELIMSLVNDVVLLMGVALVIRGDFTPGMVMAFQGLMIQFLQPVQAMNGVGQSLQEMRAQMEQIEDVMDYPIDPILAKWDVAEKNEDGTEKKLVEKLSGMLTMRDVTFGYCKLNPPLLKDFSMTLKPGKSVAIVGSSGSGKSTITRLISGVYSPWEGRILFDGKRVDEIDRDKFTGSVAVVNQDITLFEDTIANNIKMWDDSIEDFEMILAAKDAHIHEDIMKRAGGYQYRLSEGGKDFSGGQRQRMEIARVLAQDPTIVILDEATSALDAQTEFEVVSSIKKRGIACVVVAHRLSTIRDCDEIIVLDKGEVVERGTHDELMENNGLYTRLVTSE